MRETQEGDALRTGVGERLAGQWRPWREPRDTPPSILLLATHHAGCDDDAGAAWLTPMRPRIRPNTPMVKWTPFRPLWQRIVGGRSEHLHRAV